MVPVKELIRRSRSNKLELVEKSTFIVVHLICSVGLEPSSIVYVFYLKKTRPAGKRPPSWH